VGNNNEQYYSRDESGDGAATRRALNSSNMAKGNSRHRLGRDGRLDMLLGLRIRHTSGAIGLVPTPMALAKRAKQV
jgi:hypothetical protein